MLIHQVVPKKRLQKYAENGQYLVYNSHVIIGEYIANIYNLLGPYNFLFQIMGFLETGHNIFIYLYIYNYICL
jgi:hypothetical protein